MNTINDVIQNENPRDVILFITRKSSGISLPQLDRLYLKNKWIHVNDNLGLMQIVQQMVNEGQLITDNLNIFKGLQWKEPKFMTEHKYTFAEQS